MMDVSMFYQAMIRAVVLAFYAVTTQTSFWTWIVLLILGGCVSNVIHMGCKLPMLPEKPSVAAISTAIVILGHWLLKLVTGA